MVLQLRGLDLRVDSRKVSGLSSHSAAVLLRHIAFPTNNHGPDAF